ncbi:AMP-binding protein [uncultured Treponema sp.]|uniref:AMP-dependent synthetase/ligase n=1 Tax=uncultured Treponema sp. TaxID=162155 RepID=UPI0027D9CB61|nr:AMP-binding protein [uncultured Treponema sp.]
MDELKNYDPTAFLDEFRGKYFEGEWPTLPQMFDITVARYPKRPCFTDWDTDDGSKRTYTYEQSHKMILALANWMCFAGVKPGDRIAVSGKNSPEWAVVYLAALYAGAIVCPLDYALHNEELDNLLATAQPVMFFVDEEKYSYFSGRKSKYKVYSLCRRQGDTYVFNLVSEKKVQNTQPGIEDTAAILFTSGTTGTPKGVMLSHKNLVSDCYIAQTHMKIYSTDVFYALLPIHHAYTMLAVFIEAISVGAEVVFGKSMAVSRLMKELKEGEITMLLGVPLLFNKLAAGILKGIKSKGPFVYGIMKFLMGLSFMIKKTFGVNPGKHIFKAVLKQANIYTIRIAICGGGPLAKSVFRFYNEMGIDFVQGYGLTETSPIITLNPIHHFKIESVGKYFVGKMQMKIDSPDKNGIGEILVKGPMVMQGYYKMSEETAKVFTEDGWFKTGDLGWIDDENYLMLSGRVKNMIVTEGGKNVYPEEIEDAFQLETDIQQITVQGYIADTEHQSEELEALVYPSDDLYSRLNIKREDCSEEELSSIKKAVSEIVDKINKKLQPYQRITKVTVLEQPLEMTTTMKVKRNYSK